MKKQLNVRRVTGTAMASALLLAVAGAGCDGGGDIADDQPSSGSVTLISYQPLADGTISSNSQIVPVAQFRAIQQARLARQRQREAGIEVRQDALAFFGGTEGGFCNDDRTTWVYNAENGWTLPPNVSIGCFGAGFGGNWTGSMDLSKLALPDGTKWSSSLRSMWTSNTYRVGLRGAFSIIYGTWQTISTGYPNYELWHQL